MADLIGVGAVLAVAIYLLLGVGILALTLREYLRGRIAANWPATEGIVVKTRVEEHKSDGGFRYTPVVEYHYDVAGTKFYGNRLSFGLDVTDGSHSEAERIITAFPQGKPIIVRYDPSAPSRAVLMDGVPPRWLKVSAGVGAFFLACAFVAWFWPGFFNSK